MAWLEVALALSLLACKTCTDISMVINFREIYHSLGKLCKLLRLKYIF